MPCECDDGCERRCSLRGRDAVGRTGMTKLMAPPGMQSRAGFLSIQPRSQGSLVIGDAALEQTCGDAGHRLTTRSRVADAALAGVGSHVRQRFESVDGSVDGDQRARPARAPTVLHRDRRRMHAPPGVDPVPAFIGTATPISDGPRVPRRLRSRHYRTPVGCRDRGWRPASRSEATMCSQRRAGGCLWTDRPTGIVWAVAFPSPDAFVRIPAARKNGTHTAARRRKTAQKGGFLVAGAGFDPATSGT
jgi:hypothetical protein